MDFSRKVNQSYGSASIRSIDARSGSEAVTSASRRIAYAVSIHKAQGLEYDAVKIVVTNANEEDLTHSIFYTAVTRALRHLRIFWTPDMEPFLISQNLIDELLVED